MIIKTIAVYTVYFALERVLPLEQPFSVNEIKFIGRGEDLAPLESLNVFNNNLSVGIQPQKNTSNSSTIIYPIRTRAPFYINIQESETMILTYNKFFKLFNSKNEVLDCNITSNWTKTRKYPYENITTEDNHWALKIEGSKVPNTTKMSTFDVLIELKIGNKSYGIVRFLLYIWKAVPHQPSYFDIGDYDPNHIFHFYLPENSHFSLPINKNIFGENVSVSIKTQPNSSLTNIQIMNKTDYSYVGFSGYINEILSEIHSPDTYFCKTVTKYFYLIIRKDTLNMDNFQTIKLYSFNHRLKTASLEYTARTSRFIKLHKVVKVNSTDFVIFSRIEPDNNNKYKTGVYYFKAWKPSRYNKRGGEHGQQVGNWIIEYSYFQIEEDFEDVSNIQLSTKDHRKYDFFGLKKSQGGRGEVVKSMILDFDPFAVFPNLDPRIPILNYSELIGMINGRYDQQILSFDVEASGTTCMDILKFHKDQRTKEIWLRCLSPSKAGTQNKNFENLNFYVKIKMEPEIELVSALSEPPEVKNRKIESCYTNDMILFADMKGYGIFMKSRDKDFKNVMKTDFMYQNMTEEEIAGSSYTLTCFEESTYAYLQIYNSKKNKYIFYVLQSLHGWSNSRIKDINMLEKIGPVRSLVRSFASLTFYLPGSNDLMVYTSLHRVGSKRAENSNIESKTAEVMNIHLRYPKISFNTSYPSQETLTIFPFIQKKLKVFVKLFIIPVQKTEIIKIQEDQKIRPGVYELGEFLKFKGQLQSLYINHRSEKINIRPRLTYQSIDMNIVNGCPHFVYESEFAFCSSHLMSVYKDRVNDKQYTFYRKTTDNADSVIIGLAWQQLTPGLRLFLIACSYKDNICLIFYEVKSDLRTKEVISWNGRSTKILIPPESIRLFDISHTPVKFDHKINKNGRAHQGQFYLTTNSVFLCYGYRYNIRGKTLLVEKLNQAKSKMLGYGEYSGYVDSSVVSFIDFVPNIFESMVFILSGGCIWAKQFVLDYRIKPSSSIFDTQRFIFKKEGRMISCKDVHYVPQSKMFLIQCLVVCDYLDGFVYTMRVDLKPWDECRIRGVSGDAEEGLFEGENKAEKNYAHVEGGLRSVDRSRVASSEEDRVCASRPEIETIDHFFIPRGYRAQRLKEGKNYFVIFCTCKESHTGELMIFKKTSRRGGDNATLPYVWASLYIPYETTVNFLFRYDHRTGSEGLLIQKNNKTLIFYDLQTMKLEVKEGSKAVESLGIKVMNFGAEIADNSSLFNLSYRIEDLGRQESEQIRKIDMCLMVIVYLCAAIGLILIGRLSFILLTRHFGEKVGYEVYRRSHHIRRTFISGSYLIFHQMKNPNALMFETEDELMEMPKEEVVDSSDELGWIDE